MPQGSHKPGRYRFQVASSAAHHALSPAAGEGRSGPLVRAGEARAVPPDHPDGCRQGSPSLSAPGEPEGAVGKVKGDDYHHTLSLPQPPV